MSAVGVLFFTLWTMLTTLLCLWHRRLTEWVVLKCRKWKHVVIEIAHPPPLVVHVTTGGPSTFMHAFVSALQPYVEEIRLEHTAMDDETNETVLHLAVNGTAVMTTGGATIRYLSRLFRLYPVSAEGAQAIDVLSEPVLVFVTRLMSRPDDAEDDAAGLAPSTALFLESFLRDGEPPLGEFDEMSMADILWKSFLIWVHKKGIELPRDEFLRIHESYDDVLHAMPPPPVSTASSSDGESLSSAPGDA